jgi:hypothetical protein
MTRSLLLALGLSLTGAAQAGGNHAHDHKPLHGGIVAETKAMDMELVATPTLIRLHLRDHVQPLDVRQASAKLTLLSGGTKQEVELKPAGDRLEAAGSFQVGAGTKAVAVVTLSGKPSTARFTLR